MKRKMSEIETWAFLECEFKNPLDSTYTRIGLCHALSLLQSNKEISDKTYNAIYYKIWGEIDRTKQFIYLFPRTPDGHEKRAKFCRKQINLLKKEGKNVIRASKS